MTSKYELTISTKYVPDWTYVEAVRELFQNALDNEIKNPSNKMGFSYDKASETLRITNKTSILEVDSLLLGSSTKANDKDTIGKHGEGYKIAFMVLLREGKQVKVYNYGKREIWDARLIKSRRYNGEQVPVVFVEKEAFWKSTPSEDLTIEVTGITEEEYNKVVKSNLHLQDGVEKYEVKGIGRILLNEEYKGNIYVYGLYVCHKPELKYGYDFDPCIISLDRDRKLIDTINIVWETSLMWKKAFSNGFMRDEIVEMINNEDQDIAYISSRTLLEDHNVDIEIGNIVAEKFIEKYGDDAVPVDSNEELSIVRESNRRPVIVNCFVKKYIEKATTVKKPEVIKKKTLREEFEDLLNCIRDKLNDDEIERFESLINRL